MSKNVINTIAEKNNKKNKSRSWLIRIAILLSTALLTMILSYGVGIVNYERDTAGEQFGSFHGMYSRVTESDYDSLKSSKYFDSVGKLADCGLIKSKNPVGLYYADKDAREMVNVDDRIAYGRYPEAENEIFATQAFLQILGYEGAKLGDTITLKWRLNLDSKFVTKKFVIVGLQKEMEEDVEMSSGGAFVSEEFFEKNLNSPDYEYDAVFRMSDEVTLDLETAEQVIDKCATKAGLDTNDSGLSTNTAYISATTDPRNEIKLAAALLAICVVLFSMIVIYNIFQVSLVQRMQEYGRIKAIGATRKQMKQLITKEGMKLAAPVVPVGVATGYFIASLTFDWLVSSSNSVNGVNIQYDDFLSWPALAASLVLAFATVWLAMAKPKKTLAKISTIEAISYRSDIESNMPKRKGRHAHKRDKSSKRKTSGIRRGSGNVDVRSLALANIAADKKQTVRTILTMGLSCVLIVVSANCLGNIDTEYEARKDIPHGQFQLELDYTFYDKAYPENNLDTILTNNPLDKELVKELKTIDGVTEVRTQDILVVQHNNGQLEAMIVLDREDFDFEKTQGGAIGELDYDKASEEGQIIFGWSHFMDDAGIKPGDKVDYTLDNGKRKVEQESTVGGAFGSLVGGWGITEDYYESMGFGSATSIGKIWVDCDEKDLEDVEDGIKALIGGEANVELACFQDELKAQALGGKMIKSGLYALLIIIAFIGFMNMANTMISNITTKKKEYGILQAIGMTDGQLQQTLNIQGMIYIFGTLIVSMIAGVPLGYMAFKAAKSIGGFGLNTYHFPFVELGLMIVVLVLLQIFLSWLLSRNLRRESLIDRIRM